MATTTKSTDTKPEVPDLAAEVAALRNEMSNVISLMGRLGQDSATVARDSAKAKVAEGVARGSEAAGKAADRARNEWAGVESRILAETQARPWRTLGIAALGGFALGIFLRRR
ncbi:DUF883 family protein [Acidimangrovimonas sediminis]|uniref:DUF883 family protein n=1 Tax=Acidimangrovimonas sediminis TaxID=2056283 RepID=UPI000C80D3C8|nr:hypothetical protein [Acidimangrovimonas sediminis]